MTREEAIGKLPESADMDGHDAVRQMLRIAFPVTIFNIETAAADEAEADRVPEPQGIDSHDADALVQAIVEGRKADALEIVRSLRAYPGDHLHPKTELFLEGLRSSREA